MLSWINRFHSFWVSLLLDGNVIVRVTAKHSWITFVVTISILFYWKRRESSIFFPSNTLTRIVSDLQTLFKRLLHSLKKYKYFSVDYRLSPSLLPLLDFTKQYFSLHWDFPSRCETCMIFAADFSLLLKSFSPFFCNSSRSFFLSNKSHRFFQMNKISFYSNWSSIFFWFIDKILDVFPSPSNYLKSSNVQEINHLKCSIGKIAEIMFELFLCRVRWLSKHKVLNCPLGWSDA